MTKVLDASDLNLEQVHRYLNFKNPVIADFTPLLTLDPLTEFEQQKLDEIGENFWCYFREGRILEGEVKFLFLAPLMWLSGFYHPNIRITLEEGIATLEVQDNDIQIKGRMDILAARRVQTDQTALWILLIESKRTRFNVTEGLPQLLTYAYSCLDRQDAVWGLTTNGQSYQFVYIQKGNPPIYQLLPDLSLMRPDQTRQLLQVMKAICQLFRMNDMGR